MESLVLFLKWIVAMVAIPAVVFGIMIGARWWREPSRHIKISLLGMSIELGKKET